MFKLRRRFCLFSLSKSSTLCILKQAVFVFCILFSPHNLYKAGIFVYTIKYNINCMDGVNDMDYVGIGKRIRAQRYKLDLSQEELAEMAGISLST